MNAEITAAKSRINDLKESIEILQKETKELREAALSELDAAEVVAEKRKAARIESIEALRRDLQEEHDADIILTNHYKDNAHAACLATLNAADEAKLQEEMKVFEAKIAKMVDDEFAEREKNFIKEHQDRMALLLEQDADRHKERMDETIANHKRKMAELQAQLSN